MSRELRVFFPLFGSFLLVLQDHWQVFSKADFGSWVLHTFLFPAFSILFARQERIANAKPRKAPKEEKDTKEKDPEEKNGKEEAIAWVSTCLHDSKKISSPQPTASPVAKVQEEKEPEKEEEDSACGCHALRLQTRLLASALCSVQDQALPSLFDEAEHFPWGYQVIFLDPFGIESLLHNTSLVSFGASTIFYPPHSRSIWIFNEEVEPRWATSANRGRHPWRRHDGSTSCAPLQYGWLDRSKAQRGAGPGGPWRALEGKAKAERPLLSAVVFCFFCFFHFSSFARPWKILEKTSGGKRRSNRWAVLYWLYQLYYIGCAQRVHNGFESFEGFSCFKNSRCRSLEVHSPPAELYLPSSSMISMHVFLHRILHNPHKMYRTACPMQSTPSCQARLAAIKTVCWKHVVCPSRFIPTASHYPMQGTYGHRRLLDHSLEEHTRTDEQWSRAGLYVPGSRFGSLPQGSPEPGTYFFLIWMEESHHVSSIIVIH